MGENLAWGTGTLSTPQAIVRSWMSSPPHRANILHGAFRDTGIGVSAQLPGRLEEGQAGGVYTEEFGVIYRR